LLIVEMIISLNKRRFDSQRSASITSRVPENPVPSKGPQSGLAWSRYLNAIRGGDHRALAELYDAASSVVYGLALRILSDRDLAEDVVVEVFAQVWRDAGKFDPARGSATSWIISMTRSRAIDLLRSRKRERAADPIDSAAGIKSSLPDPEELSCLSERRQFVRCALGTLTVEQREAIDLAYFSGLSHSEIAYKLGQPVGTIKTRIRTAMIRLREELLGPLQECDIAQLEKDAG
jgi:RNA polymerase sigma-70 factor, ECF subfamily